MNDDERDQFIIAYGFCTVQTTMATHRPSLPAPREAEMKEALSPAVRCCASAWEVSGQREKET